MYFLSDQLRRPCDVSFYRALTVRGLEDLNLALGQHKQVLSHLAQQAKEGSRTVLRNQLFSVPDVCLWTNQGSDSSVTQNS